MRDVHRQQMMSNPIMYTLALGSVVLMGSGMLYALYLNIKVAREMGNYPEAVGLKLRKAIYFTDHNPDPPRAAKAYVAALEAAQEAGLHMLDDAVLGIWLEMARFLEKFGQDREAIDVLETQRQRCLDWIDQHGAEEENAGNRTRILQKAIQMAFKIGQLYAGPNYPDRQKSEQFLVWSVETFLKENQRRRREGLKPGEGEMGLDANQQGAQLEGLGHHYEEKGNFYFAGQLFLQALAVKPEQDCHSVILMNNIAAALAQQRPVVEPGTPPPTPAQLRESGRAWLRRAIEMAGSVKPPKRDEECDRGCVAATHNLGEFAEMDGDVREAREKYEEAASIAHAIRFDEGLIAAEEGIRRLQKR